MHPYITIPAIIAIDYRAYSRKSLTPLGIFVATLTAAVHAIHPWSLPFTLLLVFFLAGTAVTKVSIDTLWSLHCSVDIANIYNANSSRIISLGLNTLSYRTPKQDQY